MQSWPNGRLTIRIIHDPRTLDLWSVWLFVELDVLAKMQIARNVDDNGTVAVIGSDSGRDRRDISLGG